MMRRRIVLGLASWMLVTVAMQIALLGQDVIAAPRLDLIGPRGQLLFLTIRYFDQGSASKTVASRIELTDGRVSELLEFGHSGIQVFVTVPTQLPVSVSFQDGDRKLAAKASVGKETLELSVGAVSKNEAFAPVRVLPDATEMSLIQVILKALVSADTEAIVSPLPIANIDWQTLNAFAQATIDELGQPLPSASQLDGWMSWEGNLGARVLSGTFDFTHGRCTFEFMTVDQKLVDVSVRSVGIPDEWFQGPSSEEKYVQNSEQLTRSLLSGEIQLAHSLFSNRYYETVTPHGLQGLHAMLNTQFGRAIQHLEFKRTELRPYDPESRSRSLMIYHAFDMDSGKSCISQVEVVFPCGPDVISRGHLASIRIRESWPSAQPKQAELARQALEGLGLAPAEITTNHPHLPLVDLLHPQLATQMDRDKLAELSSRIRKQIGPWVVEPEWDQWSSSIDPIRSTVTGAIQTREASIDARFDFAEGELLGVTLLSPTRAYSTLDLLSDTEAVQDKARSFWTSLLEGDLPTAYSFLAKVFQEQLPYEKFKSLIQQSDLSGFSKLVAIRVDAIRLTDRLDRPLPVMTTVYLTAELEGGSFQPLRCEFHRLEGTRGGFELLNFNTDFEARFPVADDRPMNRIIEALRQGKAELVTGLLSHEDQTQVDPRILNAYLEKLKRVAGTFEVPRHSRLLYEYVTGSRRELMQCELDTAVGKVPMLATFEYGQLRSFALNANGLGFFLNEVDGQQCYHDAANNFLSTWLTQGEEPSKQYLLDELRSEVTQTKLEQLRGQLLLLNGRFQSVSLLECVPSTDKNEVQMRMEVHFQNASQPLLLDFTVDAFAARVSGVAVP